ncbi:hypothetical protein H112_01308 [Trichophyton rubrum D6]|uniref:Uncharacterized protein n=4 Tax=Trichophyton TaxID=5550 RepID=A0A178F4P7_TRIRU|nr:hypothetical protein H100_01301 [Trichophyton rubrum MR850]EZF45621.1 hypothetical protein H102_01296 [Trichophyton rubrum CBS 100081]EZF56270.1 hypothetical protein H103_01305 [Trichophyton rubrum CBS 288.86]EZF66847.1 hypothetical protein H104_01285 [Trichophyton rubrum CBS 289.86]EZF77485.1 hypothetical protein H105_01312 [Trichophyton soudanense CBS 452.61]EZF88145.1 hypothetical protein H110_01305 [Trichophyton rubrum MR1448]EZG05606.1 hypothetical protein H106_04642 [Trichophyton rub
MDAPDFSPAPAVMPDTTKNLICSPDQLSPEQKNELRAYIRKIKKFTDPRVNVTDGEMGTFLSKVFHHWTSADAIPEPPKKRMLHKFEYQAVDIGVLTEDAPIPRELLKPENVLQAATYRTPRERRAGAPVYMLAAVSYQNGSQVISLVDKHARFFPQSQIEFRYHPGMDWDVSEFMAMDKRDGFCFYHMHHYNVGIALFRARTRIVRWAAGLPLKDSSQELETAYPFQAFALFRNNVLPTSRNNARFLSLPRPGLFDLS